MTDYNQSPSHTGSTDKSPLYFAYGSNLNHADLENWCQRKHVARTPLGRSRGTALLPDMELCFDHSHSRQGGALDLRPRKGQLVEGWLYEVDDAGWLLLDEKEGAPSYYERVPVHVFDDSGAIVKAVTYTTVAGRRQGFVQPTPDYVTVVREGLENRDLSTVALEAAADDEVAPVSLDGIFVYGTLMRREDNFAALADVAELECTLLATTQGRMLDLGAFPAIVQDGDHLVHGEFMRVRNPEQVLECLDAIESFRGYHAGSLYHRVLTTVDAGDGRLRRAWTYVLADTGHGRPVITPGNWRQHCRREKSFMRDLLNAHCADRETEIVAELASRIPFSMGGDHDQVVQSLSPLLEEFIRGSVSERRLAQHSGQWVCLP